MLHGSGACAAHEAEVASIVPPTYCGFNFVAVAIRPSLLADRSTGIVLVLLIDDTVSPLDELRARSELSVFHTGSILTGKHLGGGTERRQQVLRIQTETVPASS